VNRALAALVLAFGLAACAAEPAGGGLPTMRLAAQLRLDNMCSQGRSPPIAIQNPPAGAASYQLRLTNISVLRQTPQDWTIPVPADPRRIPLGALPGYEGPCPGDFQTFTFRLEVVARAAAGEALAFGQTRMQALSVNRLAQAQWRQAGRPGPVSNEEADPEADEAGFAELFDRTDNSFDPFLGGSGGGRSLRNQIYVPR
jgi:hypothetical protein